MPQTPEEAWEAAAPPRLTREQAELLDRLQQAPRAVSHEADFETMTWTFKIEDGCRVGGGTYALVWMPNAQAQPTARSAGRLQRTVGQDGE